MVEVKTGGGFDAKRLERCIRGDEVLVGYPSGIKHPDSDLDNAQLAEYLHDGTASIPARPFLDEGLMSKREVLRKAIRDHFVGLMERGVPGARKVGALAVGAVQEFVRGDYYRSHQPNSEATIRRKSVGRKKGDRPLINTGFMINSTTYVLIDRPVKRVER